eukprot:429196-Alexandrium_andersonii.AAC.1
MDPQIGQRPTPNSKRTTGLQVLCGSLQWLRALPCSLGAFKCLGHARARAPEPLVGVFGLVGSPPASQRKRRKLALAEWEELRVWDVSDGSSVSPLLRVISFSAPLFTAVSLPPCDGACAVGDAA